METRPEERVELEHERELLKMAKLTDPTVHAYLGPSFPSGSEGVSLAFGTRKKADTSTSATYLAPIHLHSSAFKSVRLRSGHGPKE